MSTAWFLTPRPALIVCVSALATAILLRRAGGRADLAGADLRILATISAWWSLFGLCAAILLYRNTPSLACQAWTRLRKRGGALLAVTIAVASLYFGMLVNGAVANGDAALYNTQIEQGNLGERAIHWGYFLFGTVFARWLPLSIDTSMNLACAATGVVGIGLLYVLVWHMCSDACLALVASLAVGLSANYVYSAVYAEVYIVQTVACLAAVALCYAKRAVLAGILFAFAMTVSISSIVFAPLFFLPLRAQPHRGRLILAVALGYALFFAFNWESLLYGDRGLLTGAGSEYSVSRLLSGWFASAKLAVGSFPILLPFFLCAIGFLVTVGTRVQRRWLWPALLCLALHAVVGGKFREWGFDVIVLPVLSLPLVAMLARYRPVGAGWDERSGKILVITALAVPFNAACVFSIWAPTVFDRPEELRRVYQQVGRELGQHVVALGRFGLRGMYSRANERPFKTPLPRFIPGQTGEYVILDRETLDNLLVDNIDPHQIAEQVVGGQMVWHMKYAPRNVSNGEAP